MSERIYRVTVSDGRCEWPGQPIRAVDDADARRQAGSVAAHAPAGVSFTVTDDRGGQLGVYSRGGGAR